MKDKLKTGSLVSLAKEKAKTDVLLLKRNEKKSSTRNRDNQEEWEYVCKKRKREWLEEQEMGWYWTLMRNWTVEISSHLLYRKGWWGHIDTAEQVVGSQERERWLTADII